MPEPIPFQNLTREERVNFFIKCQEILQKYHPDSPFIFTKANLNDRKSYFKDFYNKYKGFAHIDENVCILFNKIKLEDARDPVRTVRENLWRKPNENYNAFMIDFVAFREMQDCLSFCQKEYKEIIKYILFARNNDIKVYETDKLLKKLSGSVLF